MNDTISFFSGFGAKDLLFLGAAALRTLWISVFSISIGTVAGVIFGWLLYEGKFWGAISLG